MNWKEINEKCPKAFLEWVKSEFFIDDNATHLVLDEEYTEHGEYHFYDNRGFMISMYSHHAIKLPFYFDQFGIFVEAYIYDDRRPLKGWKAIVSHNEGDTAMAPVPLAGFFPDRLTATIAGAAKAFEIREAQLN